MAFPQTLLVFDDLGSFECYWCFEEYPIIRVCPIFLHDEIVMGLGEEYHRGKVLFSSHHIKGTGNQQDLSLSVLTLIMWLEIVRFLYSKVTFPPISILYSLEASH